MRDDLVDDGDSNTGGKPPGKRRSTDHDYQSSEFNDVGLPQDATIGLVRRHDIRVQLPQDQFFLRPDQLGTGVAYFQPIEMGRSNAFSAVSLPASTYQPVHWDCFWFRGAKNPAANEADQLIGSFLISLFEFLAKLLFGRKFSLKRRK